MANGYKRCLNGHFYKDILTQCPYCSIKGEGASTSQGATVDHVGSASAAVGGGATIVSGVDNGKTQIMPGAGDFGGETTIQNSDAFTKEDIPSPQTFANKTMILGEGAENDIGSGEIRNSRKLVGWLVSYSFSEMGVDFKLYEGRNIIGRDLDCQISLDDNTVSAKHAVLLFRAGRYSITDQQSTQGTFVNGEDIELAPRYLNDGDIIKVGQTIFKFRSSF